MVRRILILAIIMVMGGVSFSNAQITYNEVCTTLQQLNKNWEKGDISTDSFLDKTTKFVRQLPAQGPVVSTDELLQLLNDFRTAAYKSEKYNKYKAIYFTVLMNNADMMGKSGEAIFYAEKLGKVIPLLGVKSNLQVVIMKCSFYDQNGNYKKATEVYKEEINYFDKLTKGLPDSVSNNEYISAIQILDIIVHSYSKLNNREATAQIVSTAEALYSRYVKSIKAPTEEISPAISLCRILTNFIQIENALLVKNYPTALDYLKQCDSLTNSSIGQQFPPIIQAKPSILALWLKYYLAIKDYAQAAHYLKLFNEAPHLFPDYDSYIFQKKAQLSALKNDYKTAYDFIEKALDSKSKNLATVTSDVNDLLYAHAESEFNKAQLASAEKEKKKNMMVGISIGLGLLAIILTLFIFYRRTKTNADKRIASLTTETNFQIEKAREEAGKEEQSKIAQDLHDNYSAALAGIMNKLDVMAENATSDDNETEIQSLSQYVGTLYQSVRDKSHQLYNIGQNTSSVQLEKSLRQMAEVALPDRKFKKEIEIDAIAVARLPLNWQIEILRIVQECITNIVKHAKGANEVYLFIFQEAQQAVLLIGDNGEKSNANSSEKNNQALGMESIRKRVASMKGKLNVNNDHGFTLTITIPNALLENTIQ